MEPPIELVLADRESVRIGIRLDLVGQRGAEPDQRLKRRFAHLLEGVGHIRRRGGEDRHRLRDQLSSATEHAQSGIEEHRRRLVDRFTRRVEERRSCLQPRCYGRDAGRGVRLITGQERIQGLEQVVEPEYRISDMGLFVLHPKHGAADLTQQRRTIDLLLHVLRVQFLHRPGQRSEGRDVFSRRLGVEATEPAILAEHPGGAGRRRVEVILQVQVGPAEIVNGGHGPSSLVNPPAPVGAAAQDDGCAVTSEWSPSEVLP